VFKKLRKETVGFWVCPSVRPSLRSCGTIRIPLGRFSLSLIFEDLGKSVEKIQLSLKSDNNNEYFT
jgi:hypothetical protein